MDAPPISPSKTPAMYDNEQAILPCAETANANTNAEQYQTIEMTPPAMDEGFTNGNGKIRNRKFQQDLYEMDPLLQEVAQMRHRKIQKQSEVPKILLSLVYALIIFAINSAMVVIADMRLPFAAPPLPDIILDTVTRIPYGFHITEIIIIVELVTIAIIIFCHRQRCVILRRYMYVFGTCYLLRCFTLPMTALSIPGPHLVCHKHDARDLNTAQIIKKTLAIWLKAGFRIQGVSTCGDLMFSGHTVGLTALALFISDYTRGVMLHSVVKYTSYLLSLLGIVFILLGHEHYTIDVFVAFIFTFFVYRYYHDLAHNPIRFLPPTVPPRRRPEGDADTIELLDRKIGTEVIYLPFFRYLEANCAGRLDFDFHWPLPKFSLVFCSRVRSTLRNSLTKTLTFFKS